MMAKQDLGCTALASLDVCKQQQNLWWTFQMKSNWESLKMLLLQTVSRSRPGTFVRGNIIGSKENNLDLFPLIPAACH